MTAVIYARYSSDNQREESIEGQIRECTAYAEKNGITIVKHYIDRAISAKTDNRPEFQQIVRVHVCGDQHLKSLAPDLACQRHADFVALLRGNLSLAEALVGVERHHAVCFTKAFLYSPHIFPRMICPAMDAGDKLGALVQLCLGIVLCVVQRLGQGHRIRFCPGWRHNQGRAVSCP